MSVDTRKAFAFMRLNYRYGLLDKTATIMGEALDGAMQELGLDFEDVLMRLDGAGEQAIEKINAAVEKWSGLALRLAVNDPMTRLQSRLLDIAWLRRRLVTLIKGRLVKVLAANPCETGRLSG
jgi:hypothetical protein